MRAILFSAFSNKIFEIVLFPDPEGPLRMINLGLFIIGFIRVLSSGAASFEDVQKSPKPFSSADFFYHFYVSCKPCFLGYGR